MHESFRQYKCVICDNINMLPLFSSLSITSSYNYPHSSALPPLPQSHHQYLLLATCYPISTTTTIPHSYHYASLPYLHSIHHDHDYYYDYYYGYGYGW